MKSGHPAWKLIWLDSEDVEKDTPFTQEKDITMKNMKAMKKGIKSAFQSRQPPAPVSVACNRDHWKSFTLYSFMIYMIFMVE